MFKTCCFHLFPQLIFVVVSVLSHTPRNTTIPGGALKLNNYNSTNSTLSVKRGHRSLKHKKYKNLIFTCFSFAFFFSFWPQLLKSCKSLPVSGKWGGTRSWDLPDSYSEPPRWWFWGFLWKKKFSLNSHFKVFKRNLVVQRHLWVCLYFICERTNKKPGLFSRALHVALEREYLFVSSIVQ